ncbi:MAG: hypothetical protein KAJ44_04970 [Thermoplasmatales archaeon]|nr:hypothetical protein [Thermoplasmatales archaeon]
MIQTSKKLKVLDKKRLLEQQNKQRVKYGLKPHKRLDIEFITIQNDTHLQTNENERQIEKDYLEGYA